MKVSIEVEQEEDDTATPCVSMGKQKVTHRRATTNIV